MSDTSELKTAVLSFLNNTRQAYIDDLADLVNRDCGTDYKFGVDKVADWFETRCKAWGWATERIPQRHYGDCIVARTYGQGQARVMLIGHLDTVYPQGIAAIRPMRFAGDKIIGPGTCDIKGGLLTGIYALRALQQAGFADFGEIVLYFNSEEEVGSPVSQHLYTPIAKQMNAALVLEAARQNGDIVSARKGVANYRLRVHGKQAHAGVEPEKGANAILELAHRIVALHKLNGITPGVTLNTGVIQGGVRSNVVPDEAWVDIDIRVIDQHGAQAIIEAMQNLLQAPCTVTGTRIDLSGGFGFMPMAKSPDIAKLVAWAQACALELGFAVKDAATGGVSDANVIAALSTPVLDGLGPIGGLDHGPDEYIEASSIVPRTAMLALLIEKICQNHAS